MAKPMAELMAKLQELSVMPMPLALGLDLVMNRPNRVRFVDLPSEGKAKAQEADKRKHAR